MVSTHKQQGRQGGGNAPLEALRALQSIDAAQQRRRQQRGAGPGGGVVGGADHLATLEFLARSLKSALPEPPEGAGVPVSNLSYLRRNNLVSARDDGGYFYN